ncbi:MULTISPECIES: acyl-ACP--UDP-N-acetylglucosamine O-acyltransferase [Vibrio]|uniref:Acyl-[acyl-carrier-protein]--UDP-N-acetylglucosamine O-acyltransferase n=2 Tax=Vibrio genomosp. F10 TaxID=723171 RepID=A0A1B9R1N2_9VIBR|nr:MULTISPECIES: acyl-ACP--UDP-N-acetylglucosamine O-acyltransferase [Vibrio]OCH77954.1 acyl-[acyl-carrier-protein]--UDP-N-acetylglucosamine O-acyltransferase [Vibrio genomosp. F10]OEE38428.1 acyl-[acyl-carrier-protein]--UDP-N-acetylglucosamine O-acyltransferase [Vibrio genomosp. F10 str. ZF-129]OEE93305.1 acyl-[acyl-carrier-protein]--UDP-N-acetylglucosamine O-acyltransferase [Vibrio genomosp. F10 str. 9ZC157]OEE96247.1 acyl-[acyl-carrier-protein]--UDP-N-acetylglucosamine O-acyltransferase [Vib
MIHETAKIHPSAVIEGEVTIEANVTVGPFTYISGNVVIGENTEIMSHIVIKGNTTIGKDNRIFPYAIIGEENQDKKYGGEATTVVVGDRNVIRESVQIHRGTTQDKATTVIGDDNLLCVNAHIAHDVIVGNHTHIGNNAILGGHVTVGDHAGVMALSAIHPFCSVGAYSYVGGCSAVVQDVLPYVLAQGNHATPFGLNLVGLKRNGFERTEIRALQKAYKEIYRAGKTLEEAKPVLLEMAAEFPSIKPMIDMLESSERGIIR